jgi:hypothetical protein
LHTVHPTNHLKVSSVFEYGALSSFYYLTFFLHIATKSLLNNMNNIYLDAVSDQLFATSFDDSNCSPKREHNSNDASMLSWPSTVASSSNDEPVDLVNVLGPTDLDISSLIWQVDHNPQNSSNPLSNSLISSFDNLLGSWNNNIQVPPTIKEEWAMNNVPVKQEHQEFSLSHQNEQPQPFKLPLTPPFDTNSTSKHHPNSFGFTTEPLSTTADFNDFYSNTILKQVSREITPPTSATVSSFASSSNSPHSNVSTPPPSAQYLSQQHLVSHLSSNPMASSISTPTKSRSACRRRSSDSHSASTRTYRRRASSHPSVASVVSLSAHEPVSRMIDGIEHITFLYSHDRLVKEYTVRTDIESVNLEDIPLDFRVPNAVSNY